MRDDYIIFIFFDPKLNFSNSKKDTFDMSWSSIVATAEEKKEIQLINTVVNSSDLRINTQKLIIKILSNKSGTFKELARTFSKKIDKYDDSLFESEWAEYSHQNRSNKEILNILDSLTDMDIFTNSEVQHFTLSIGIDFGGVCSIEGTDNIAIDVPDCLTSLQELKSVGHRLVLISFCGAARARKIRALLTPLGLFDVMYFVKDAKYKQFICQAEGINLMIDDRLDVLRTIKTKTMLFDAYNHISNIHMLNVKPDYTVYSWPDALQFIKSIRTIVLKSEIDIGKYCY